MVSLRMILVGLVEWTGTSEVGTLCGKFHNDMGAVWKCFSLETDGSDGEETYNVVDGIVISSS